MRKLLIVDSSGLFAESLAAYLHPQFDIRICTDSSRVLGQLQKFRPDFLVMDIHLPGCDGITLLRQTPFTPPHIIALTRTPSPYTLQTLLDLGADYVLMLPCTVQAVAGHLENMVRLSLLPKRQRDPRDIVREHLRILGFQDGQQGFMQLCVEIPLYAQDPYQSLSKELHPAVAQICGDGNGNQVESKIRRLIADVWVQRNPAVWNEYFPDLHEKPKIRQFLCLMAAKLNLIDLQASLAQNE